MSSGNLMQRAYDAMAAATEPLPVDALCTVLHLGRDAVRDVLRRLRRQRCICSNCTDHVWRYSIRVGAVRPGDSRGKRRQ